MPVTFDGPNMRITLPAMTGSLDVQQELYSFWKEWVKIGDNGKYAKAFDTIGGDPAGSKFVAPYFFLRNDLGWTIRGPEEHGEIILVGNLYPRDPSRGYLEPTVGAFSQLITIELSANALAIQTGGGGGDLTAVEVRQEMDSNSTRLLSIDTNVQALPSAAAIVAAIFAHAVEGSRTLQGWLRLAGAVLINKATLPTQADGTFAYRDEADTKDRLTGSVSVDGKDRTISGTDDT